MKTKAEVIASALKTLTEVAKGKKVEIKIGKYSYARVPMLTPQGTKWLTKRTLLNRSF